MTYGNNKNKKAEKFANSKELENKEQKGKRYMSIGTLVGLVAAVAILFSLPHILPPPSVNAHNVVVAEHSHVHIEGVALPAGIGIDSALWKDHSLDKYGINGYAPLHVHDNDGYIHIETNEIRTYTLQDFLNIWGVKYQSVKLEYVSDAGFMGGPTYTNIPDPTSHVLHDGEKLRLTFDNNNNNTPATTSSS